jgi:DNA-binding GntR family transcriptional regulator
MRRPRGIHKPVNGLRRTATIGPRGHGRGPSISGPCLKDPSAAGVANRWAPKAVFARVAGPLRSQAHPTKRRPRPAVMTEPRQSTGSLVELQSALLASRARGVILTTILTHEFDDTLPSEGELAKALNVSRTTIRATAQDLERDGVIKRQRAAGATINHHVGHEALALRRRVAFEWRLDQRRQVDGRVTFTRHASPDGELDLPWDPSLACCVIETDYLADGRLTIALRDFVPWATIKVDNPPASPVTAVFEFTRRYCRNPITQAVGRIVPLLSTNGVTRLALPSSTPFVRLQETHYSARGEAIAWSLLDFDHSTFRLKMFRRQ